MGPAGRQIGSSVSRSRHLLIVIVTLAVAAGCASHPDADHRTATATRGPGRGLTVQVSSASTSTSVDPDHAFTLTVPGVGDVSGPAGSFTSAGSISARPVTVADAGGSDYQVSGRGIDVSFAGTSLREDLTVRFTHVAAAQPDSMVSTLHVADDGASNLVPADVDTAGAVVIHTRAFSINLPITLNPLNEVRDLLTKVKGYLVHEINGRTDPINCPGGAPGWSRLGVAPNLVHTCMITNKASDGTPRAEVQIKSNRQSFVAIDVPAGADYVWVKDQPDWLRRGFASLWHADSGRYVVLSPGGTMTAGFRQPPQLSTRTFAAEQNGETRLLSLLEPIFEAAGLATEDANVIGALLLGQCATTSTAASESPIDFLKCVTASGLAELKDPSKAVAGALSIFGEAGYFKAASARMGRLTFLLQALGTVLFVKVLFDLVRDQLIDIADMIARLMAPGDETTVLYLDPPARTPQTTPPTVPTTPPVNVAPVPAPVPAPAPAPATGPPSPPTPAPASPPAQASASASGVPETVGSNAHTWTNYTNAGGAPGATIPQGSSVSISCRINGFRVADGNTWWYRIASSPWNNAYYVSADAFYNNGQTSGSLHGTPWVDEAVPTC